MEKRERERVLCREEACSYRIRGAVGKKIVVKDSKRSNIAVMRKKLSIPVSRRTVKIEHICSILHTKTNKVSVYS